jgi:hypothetical protein
MPRQAACAEVGVWKGDGAAAILRHTSPRKLTLVDPWEHLPQEGSARAGRAPQQALDDIHASVASRFAEEIEAGQVELIRARSEQAWERFGEGELDWVWLDGDHSYEAVKHDLEALRRIVRPGGFIIGDDYTYGWWGDGVIRAVDEFAAAVPASLEITGEIFFKITLPQRT